MVEISFTFSMLLTKSIMNIFLQPQKADKMVGICSKFRLKNQYLASFICTNERNYFDELVANVVCCVQQIFRMPKCTTFIETLSCGIHNFILRGFFFLFVRSSRYYLCIFIVKQKPTTHLLQTFYVHRFERTAKEAPALKIINRIVYSAQWLRAKSNFIPIPNAIYISINCNVLGISILGRKRSARFIYFTKMCCRASDMLFLFVFINKCASFLLISRRRGRKSVTLSSDRATCFPFINLFWECVNENVFR